MRTAKIGPDLRLLAGTLPALLVPGLGCPVVFAYRCLSRRIFIDPPLKPELFPVRTAEAASTEVLLQLFFCRAKFVRTFYPSPLVGNFKLLPSVVPGSRQASRVSSLTIRAFRL